MTFVVPEEEAELRRRTAEMIARGEVAWWMTEEETEAAAEVWKANHPAQASKATAEEPEVKAEVKAKPVGILLSDVKPSRVHWLWEGRIPLGKLTVLDGDPGNGKSTLTMDLAARVTRGLDMPDGTPGVDGGVVLLTAEDGLDDTVVPRLLAARGDPRRVLALEVVGQGKDEHDPMLPDDLDAVEAAIGRVKAKLVIVDPLMAFLPGSVNAHRDQDVRRALRRLSSLADKTGAAIVVVRHLNKVAGGGAIHRGGGSIGIIGAARAGLLVAKDPDDEQKRVLAVTKSNLGPAVESLVYTIEGVTYQTDDETGETSRVRWQGTSTMTADGLLAAVIEDPEERGALGAAVEFLREELKGGVRIASAELLKKAKAEGHSERTLKRARNQLRVRSDKMRDGWFVMLPQEECQEGQEGQGSQGERVIQGPWLGSLNTDDGSQDQGQHQQAGPVGPLGPVDPLPACPTCGGPVAVAPGRRDDGHCPACNAYVTPVWAEEDPDEDDEFVQAMKEHTPPDGTPEPAR